MKNPCPFVRPFVRRSVWIALLLVVSVAVLEPCAHAAARPTRLQPKPAPAAAALQEKAADVSSSSAATTNADALGVERVAALDYLYKQLIGGEPFSHEEAKVLYNYKAGFAIDTLEADVVISRAIYADLVQHKPLSPDQREVYENYRAWKGVQLQDVLDLKLANVAAERAAWTASPRAPQVAPPNDLCAGAEVIPAAGPFPYLTSTTADITDATVTGDPPLPSCQTNVSRSIWYTITPSATALYTFSACADAPTASTVDDTVIAVYTSTGGCAGPFTQVAGACDDDSCATEGLQSVLNVNLTSGTTYYVVVWKFDTPAPTVGNTAIQLRVSQTLPPPVPANDLCAGAIPLTLNTAVQGTLAGGTNDYTISTPSATCFPGIGQTTTNTAPGRDVVYSFTPASSGNYSFRLFSREGWISSAVMFLVPGPSCPPAGAIACSATMIGANRQTSSTAFSNVEEIYSAALVAGTTYYIFVDESTLQTTFGAFTIEAFASNKETEPNGTTATANALQCNLEAAIGAAADVDFYSLGTPAAGSRVFAMADGAAGSSTDQDMRITTATDTLQYDDDNNDVAFGSLSPNCVGTPLTGVASFIRMSHFSASSTQEPHRIFSVIQPPGAGLGGSSATAETEPNDTTATASFAVNNFFSGSAASTVDTDLFAFTATAGEVIFLGLDGDPLRDNTPRNFALALLDSTGTVLLTMNDAQATSSTASGAGSLTATTPLSPGEALVFRAITSGTYYARVTMPTGTGGAAADYLLSVAKDCTIGGGIAPCMITCPANVTVPETTPGSGSAVVSYAAPTTTGTCGTVTCTPASGSTFTVGTTTVNCSTTAGPSCSFTVTVTATCAITCPANITVGESSPGSGSATVSYPAPTSTPGCGTVTCTPASGSSFPVGTTTVNCSTTAGPTCSFTITVVAGCAITCPANITVSNTSGQCSAVVNYPAPTTTMGCGTVTCTPASGSTFPVGTTTVSCSTTAGPTCSFTVTVNDTQAPTVTCPANITTPAGAGQCSAVVTYTTPTASDNCPGATVACVPASGSTFAIGTTTVTCTATDAASNTGTCSFTVTVNDTQAPTVTCPANISVPAAAGQCSAVVTYTTPTASDNCPGATVACSPASGSTFPVGTTTVTCTATDASSNTGTCSFSVTVNDTQAPTVACPANITVPTATNQCSAVVTYTTPTASDNCPGATVACVPASGSTFPKGTTTVTCTATDASANTGTCTFTVTVNDTQAPSITCPANIAVPASTMMGTTPGAIVTFAAPVVSDNCPGVGAPVCSPASGSFFAVGVNMVTCSVTDAMANTSMCSFTITVGTPFGVCVINDGPVSERDTLKIVTDPTSALYRFWQYTDVSTGTIYQGYAEFLVYTPGRSLTAYDHDSANVRMDMQVDYSRLTSTATVKNLTTGVVLTLRDRDITNDPPCQ